MADAFKENLEKFLISLIEKIQDKNLLPEIQSQYDSLMDEFLKANFISQEEFDKILEQELTENESQINKLKTENEKISNDFQMISIQKEGLLQKIEILQNSLENFSKKEKEIENLNKEISNQKINYDLLKSEYEKLKEVCEINQKNLKKFFNMEKSNQILTEENEKLHEEIKKLNDKEDFKSKFEEIEIKNKIYKNEIENFEIENKKLKKINENNEISINNFKISLTNAENEIKLKNYKIENLSKKIFELNTNNNNLLNKIKEIEFNQSSNSKTITIKNKELKNEFDKIYKSNEKYKNENILLKTELKKFQNYTNVQKVSKENFTKKDFSVLETMSRKVEEVNSLNDQLKNTIDFINAENKLLKSKNNNMENCLLYYMKNNEMENFDVNDIKISEKDYNEIIDLKVNSNLLINMLFKLKGENIKLINNVQQITTECNKELRNLKEGMKNNHKQDPYSLP